MRIIVTNAGNQELKTISIDQQPNGMTASRSEPKIMNSHLSRCTKISTMTRNTQKSDPPLNISVKQKKILIPKHLSEKYMENINEDNKSTLLPDILFTLNKETNKTINQSYSQMSNSSELPQLKEYYSLKEVIPQNTLKKLKAKIKNDQQMKAQLAKFNENNFRAAQSDTNIFQQISETSESLIKADKVNIIEYLTGKTTVSDHFIKQLASFEEERLNKLNKVCQKMLHNRKQEEIFKNRVLGKIQVEKKKEEDIYKRGILSLERNLNLFNHICEKERIKKNSSDRYMYIHRDIQEKYWDKFNVDRFSQMKKKQNPHVEKTGFNEISFS